MSVEQQAVAPIAVKTGLSLGGAGGAKAMETADAINVIGLSLGDIAALVAIGFTLHQWGNLAWRLHIRPYCEKRGWLKRARRRHDDTMAD